MPRTAPGRLRSTLVHTGRRIEVRVDQVRMPDGSEAELDMIRHPGAAAVVPIRGSEIVLIRQYRYAAGGYIWEIPAGIPDRADEPWEECARRELEEETGLRTSKLELLTSIYTTPGFTDEVIHIYLGTGLSRGSTDFDRDEFIDIERMPFRRAVEMVRTGEIRDAKSITGILCAKARLG